MTDSQTTSETNMVNLYNSRLKEFNIDQKITDARNKLDQWREQSYKTIDQFYQQKLTELNSYIEQFQTIYQEKSTEIQTNLSQLDNEQNPDIRNTKNQLIEQNLKDIEKLSLKVSTRSLNINENYISIEKQLDLSTKLTNSSKFFYTNASSSAIASNEQYLLMHQQPYLCLIDQDLKIIKQIFWKADWIRDMCWSNTLNCFIILTANHIYSIDEHFQSIPILQQNFLSVWFSSTCSDEHLYISTCEWGSSIYQLSLSSPINVIQQWKPPLTCQDDEGINDIKYNNQTIALMIKNSKTNEKRMELKSTKDFSTIWICQLSIGSDIRLFTCCPINLNEWLVVDGTNSHIYQITTDGKFKCDMRYDTVPYRINFFRPNILAISAEYDLNLYQI